MSNQQSYLPFEISDLAEGAQKTSESAQPTSHFQMTTVSAVYSGCGVKDFSAEEGLISQVGAVLEGRDDTHAQDAALTTDEGKLHRNAQTVPYGVKVAKLF